MLSLINIYNLIFLDIETVPQYSSFGELSPAMQELWGLKHATLRIDNESAADGYLKRAGVYSEFAKIVCVSIGFFHFDKEKQQKLFRVRSVYGHDEKQLLESLLQIVAKSFADTDCCGHNIREFDIPFICRRLLINGLQLPPIFDLAGKKPWENTGVDTMQLWKFGDYKSYTSLKLLAAVFNIPTPKDDIDGKDVCRVYWEEKGLERIATYCQKDVVTVARLLLRFKGDTEPLTDEQIVIVK